MGLTQKILLFTSLLVVALVATTVGYTTLQANRLADRSVAQGLAETRGVWEAFQADRYNKLKLGIRVLGNDPAFKAAVETNDQPTILDLLKERGQELNADFFLATDSTGVVVARTDRLSAQGEDLSQDPVVMKPLEGEESATIWREEDRLYHAVSVPMVTSGDLKGVLVAGYGINEGLANDIRKLTHSQMAYLTHPPGKPPHLSVSSLGLKEPSFRAALGRAGFAAAEGSAAPFRVDLDGEAHLAVTVPLRSAMGDVVGSVVALRSLPDEMAAFNRFRNSLVAVSLVVMAFGLGLAYLIASRITGPVRRLVDVVERARDGSYAGAVSVDTSDEIGVLARTFNGLLADLHQKEQMIDFLREGMTELRRGGITASAVGTQETATLNTVGPTQIAAGGLFAGRYEILDTLGRGGMGVVYRAMDRTADDMVALKVLRPDVLRDDPSLLTRFKQEMKLARRITHRNVLRTYDLNEADGTAYISMEYLEGITLKDLLVSKGALPLGVGLRIAKQMCAGLEAAHREGVVHRDIKPHNMLILPETGELKIMDFGIARGPEVKAESSGLTSAGTVMGTPDYMPPEQAQGRPADFRSDIYSLGVVLYEVFTGRLPFKGDSPMAVVMAHIQSAPPPPRRINPQLPEELEAIILRAMEKDPGRRYREVAELQGDLDALSSRVGAAADAA